MENDTKSLVDTTFSPLDKGLKGGGGCNTDSYAAFQAPVQYSVQQRVLCRVIERGDLNEIFKSLRLMF